MNRETAIAAWVSEIPSLRGLGEFRHRMTKSKLALGGDVDGGSICRQRQHHGRVTGRVGGDDPGRQRTRIGCEQNRTTCSASSRLMSMQCDRQIQLASWRSFLMV